MDFKVVFTPRIVYLVVEGASAEKILGKFFPILGSSRWLAISEFNHTWYMISLLIGDYYCGVRKVWLSFVWYSWMKTCFFDPKTVSK